MAQKNYTKTEAGQNHAAAFFRVAMLFRLRAVLNSLIDTMDQHFQDLLHPSTAQSAWRQFAHYYGYTLMALPAGLISRRIGYERGLIFGLILVSLGCGGFVPAAGTAQFRAFLVGVCAVAMGLTGLATVANPAPAFRGSKDTPSSGSTWPSRSTALAGAPAPNRLDLFPRHHGRRRGGQQVSRHSESVHRPVCGRAIVRFWRAKLPEIATQDEFHAAARGPAAQPEKTPHPGLAFALMLAGAGGIVFSLCAILIFILISMDGSRGARLGLFCAAGRWGLGPVQLCAPPPHLLHPGASAFLGCHPLAISVGRGAGGDLQFFINT